MVGNISNCLVFYLSLFSDRVYFGVSILVVRH
jgi:hypothetical protein